MDCLLRPPGIPLIFDRPAEIEWDLGLKRKRHRGGASLKSTVIARQ